jgi:hypothetical protein
MAESVSTWPKGQEVRDSFSVLLRTEMTYRHWSIRRLAKASGLSVSSLQGYRNGTADIPLWKVHVLVDTLGCTFEQITELL